MHRRSRTSASVGIVVALVAALAFAGCTPSIKPSTERVHSGTPVPIRIGVLPTEDSLPFWAAEAEGVFDPADLSVQLVPFQAAQERDAALASGSIDGFMGDLIAASNLEAGGTPVSVEWVMLGEKPDQGRFGIVAAPKSGITDLRQLAGVPIGTSSATIQEYVLDGLMEQAGVAASDIKTEEVKKVPVRFELLMQGKLKAAALPEPFLSLAEKQGAKLLAEDTKGANLSQTVFLVSDEFAKKPGAKTTIDKLRTEWDAEVAKINAKPDEYRELLVEKARLPEPLKADYAINTYPTAAPPTRAQVDAVLEWMRTKTYLKGDVTYEKLVPQQ